MSHQRILDTERGFTALLLAWGLGSMVAGALWMRDTRLKWRGVGQQFLAWGAIDAVLALNGLRGNANDRRLVEAGQKSSDELRSKAGFLRNVLWFNVGMDLLYLLAGRWLTRHNNVRWQGWGWGVLPQASFLLLFDALFGDQMNGHARDD